MLKKERKRSHATSCTFSRRYRSPVMTMSVMRLAALMMNNICVVREEGKKKKGWYSSWVGSLKYYI